MGHLAPQETKAQSGAGNEGRPLVELQGVSKRFGGVQAVIGVSLAIRRGAVHAVVGENGAGKSTLAKIIGGVYEPDDGRLLVDGQPVRFRSPREALGTGIATIAQELALVPARSVVDNVFLGMEPRKLGVIRPRDLNLRFSELNERTGFRLPGGARVGTLRVADQQKVEILRALARDARLILMDEPTASLTADETDRLLGIIRRLSASGTAIVLVSHFLEEVLAVSDQVTVMRDGRIVRTAPAQEESEESLVAGMIGRKIDLSFPLRNTVQLDAPVVLEARNLQRAGAINDVSLIIRAGEIVGLAGLVGSGRSEVLRALFGADPLDGGTILVDGRPVRMRTPRDAARLGVAMLPESRKDQGLFMRRPIRENTTVAYLEPLLTAGVINTRRERRAAEQVTEELGVRMDSIEAPVVELSGGNQQKVLFAKWLLRRPKVLLADEPTRGVDVGAKRQIYELLNRLAANGMGVLLVSSEMEEVLGLAHRVLVLRSGRVVASFAGQEATKERVMSYAFQNTRTATGDIVL